jgi:hypothetical protein
MKGEDVHIVQHTEPSIKDKVKYRTGRINKGALRANAALIGLDLANDLYEHADEIKEAADLVPYLVNYVGEYADEVAGYLITVLENGDYSNVLPTAAGILGVPLATRTVDNLASLMNIEGVHTSRDLKNLEQDVQDTILEPVKDAVPEPVREEVKSFNQDLLHNGVSPASIVGTAIDHGVKWLTRRLGW